MSLIRPTKLGANDNQDMVVITLGELSPRIAYQSAFEIAHALRMACKSAARHDRVRSDFWPDVEMEDLKDCPRPNRYFRRSDQAPNVKTWSIRFKGAEVALLFDERGVIVGYEDGIKLHQMIRRAGRRAKAWAGESRKGRAMLSNLTDAEDDYRLGLG